MAKYSPKTYDELKALVDDESVNLGDIDTSAITDMFALFFGSDRKDFSGIEKWDTSNVTNMGMMFDDAKHFNHNINDWDVSNVANMKDIFSRIYDKIKLPTWYLKQFENNTDKLCMVFDNASAICKQLKVAYIVNVNEYNVISEVIEQYPSRLEATWALKERYDNGDLDDDKDYYAVIGYEPNEITPKSLEPLIDMQVEDADWLLRRCIHRAIAFDNTDGTYHSGSVGKILGVYATRLEIIEKFENNYPNEWQKENDVQSLGYQPRFDVKIFVGREFWFLVEALRWVEWVTIGWQTYWWVEVIEDDGQIVRIVKEFHDKHKAEKYEKKLPPAKSGRYYALGDNAGIKLRRWAMTGIKKIA